MRFHWRWIVSVGALFVVIAAFFGGEGVSRWWALRPIKREIYTRKPLELIASLAPLEQKYPDDAEVLYLLAVAQRRAGKTNKAREYIDRAEQLGWSPSDIQRQDYMIRFQTGDVKEPERYLFSLGAQGYPDDSAVEIYECMVQGYLSDMRLQEANLMLDHWIAWQPRAPQPRLLKAELLSAVRENAQAIEQYRQLVEIDPKNIEVRMKLGYALLGIKEVDGALEQFDQCTKLAPDDPGLLVALAAYYRHVGKLAEARSALERSLKGKLKEGKQAAAWFELGQLELAEKKSDSAIDYFTKALKLAPGNARAHYGLGLALSRAGRKDEANEHLQKSERLDEQSSRYADVMHGIIRDPENADLRCEAGEILLDQGERKEAYIWLASALRCNPRHSATHKVLSRYYALGGKMDLAEQHLDLAGDGELSGASVSPIKQ